MDVAAWLPGLGLESCAGVPRQRNRLGRAAEALKDLDVVLGGHRRGLLDAIAALGAAAPAASATAAPRDAPALAEAERRQLTVILRPGRLDRTVGAARSRGSARDNRRVSPRRRRSGRRVRRLRRQVHG
jgi:hypothetical protein